MQVRRFFTRLTGAFRTSASPQYDGPFTVSPSLIVKTLLLSQLATALVRRYQPRSISVNRRRRRCRRFLPNGGTFSTSQQVTISDSLAGATILFTTDGSLPSSQSPQYNGPIILSTSELVKARAFATGYGISGLATATFTIHQSTTPTPVISPSGGTFSTPQLVTITDSLVGATILYTTDGSTPTSLSTHYSGPITVSSNEVITAFAVEAGYSVSASATASFTISGALHTYPAGLAMISLPSDYSGQSLDTVLGYSSPVLAIWDPVSGQYDVSPTPPADGLHIGYGYWVRFPQTVTIDTLGTPTPTDAPFLFSLSAGWNMVGDPFPADELLTGITVTPTGGVPETFEAAVSSGLIQASVFGYTPAGYYVTDRLSQYQGYWIAATAACTLGIPVASGPPPPPT